MDIQKGKMIVLAGADGTGKTSAATYLKSYLDELGIKNIRTREPGGSKMAEAIRDLVLSKEYDPLIETEMLLMWAARVEHVNTTIKPALEAGLVVICERFAESTFVYQAYPSRIVLHNQLYAALLGDFKEDHVLFLHATFDTCRARTTKRDRENDRMDLMSEERAKHTHKAYAQYLITERTAEYRAGINTRFHVINAEGDELQVQQQIRDFVNDKLI